MENIADFSLNMIPDKGKSIFYQDEFLLADSIGVDITTKEIKEFFPKNSYQVGYFMSLFCLSGELSFLLNRQKITMHANDVVIIKNNDIGNVIDIPQKFEIFAIGFANNNYIENLYSKNVWELRNFILFNNHFTIPEQDMQEYYHFYQMMRNKLTDENFLPKKEFVAKSLSLMGVIMQNNLMHASIRENQMVNHRNILLFEQFMNLVAKHFRKEHALQFYADALCITPKYMSQIIYEVSGHFAGDWIKKYMVDEAKTMLKSGTYTINQVSDKLGFTTPSYFTRFFKRETDMTPLEFQKE